MRRSTSALPLLLCLLALASAVESRNSWQRFVDFIVPEPFREFFGGSPTEEARRILSEADILELERPLDGTVEAGETHPLRLAFPSNGDEMPNIMLSLTILNEDGDADIYCMPEFLFTQGEAPPSASFSVWKSEHSSGADHIFISRRHELYQDSRVDVTEFGNEGVSFVCSVVGFSPTGTDYRLEVDVDYTERALVEVEKAAMQNLFDRCCLGSASSCKPWKDTKTIDDHVDMDMCHVAGNVCNDKGNLIRLDLSGLAMDCAFPIPSIAKLESLMKLDMSDNFIRGDMTDILESLSMKKDLEYINLSSNNIKGSIHEEKMGAVPVCKLTRAGDVSFLDLADNQLVTELPKCMFDRISSLRDFALDGNAVEGTLPDVPDNSSMKVLRLKDVGLQGTIPANMGSWENLLVLNLANNSLEGSIPQGLGEQSPLLSLNLDDNNLKGLIPDSLAVGSYLKYIRLSNNSLESFGDAWNQPDSMSESKLQILEVSGNSIEGSFPSGLGSAPDLQVVVLADNNLSGQITGQEGMCPKCVVFMIQNNRFNGGLPKEFADMGIFSQRERNKSPYFPELDISNNRFTGVIPEYMWAVNIPEILWDSVIVGGNNFDIPCPLPLNLIHLKDLDCEAGETILPSAPLVINTSETLARERLVVPPILQTAIPEPEDEEDAEDEQEIVDSTDEPLAEIEYSEAELASIDSNGDISVLALSNPGDGLTSGGEGFEDSSDASRKESKTFAAQIGGFKIIVMAGVSLLAIMVLSVVIVAKKKRKAKSEVLSDVLAADLEMSPVSQVEEEGDEQILLNRVKPSSVL